MLSEDIKLKMNSFFKYKILISHESKLRVFRHLIIKVRNILRSR